MKMEFLCVCGEISLSWHVAICAHMYSVFTSAICLTWCHNAHGTRQYPYTGQNNGSWRHTRQLNLWSIKPYTLNLSFDLMWFCFGWNQNSHCIGIPTPCDHGTMSYSAELNNSLLYKCLGLILGLCPADERRRYRVTVSLIGWEQT